LYVTYLGCLSLMQLNAAAGCERKFTYFSRWCRKYSINND
jgi:hypothetical protein